MAIELKPWEKAVLAICQDNLPDGPAPYAEMAAVCGASEAGVIALLKRLKASGAIRRFGATIRHHNAGWSHNAMAAWIATQEEAEQWGPVAARHPLVSHVYFRPSSAPDWPYTLYTMTHGRSEAECGQALAELAASWPGGRHVTLKTLRELKKTSMTYFEESNADG